MQRNKKFSIVIIGQFVFSIAFALVILFLGFYGLLPGEFSSLFISISSGFLFSMLFLGLFFIGGKPNAFLVSSVTVFFIWIQNYISFTGEGSAEGLLLSKIGLSAGFTVGMVLLFWNSRMSQNVNRADSAIQEAA